MSNGTAYRRGSVFGALLLIAIGGLFLYANFQPEFSPWPLVAKYWPVLIIFWGLGKLVDYLMLRGRPEAAAATRLTGGDIFALILILCFGTLFSQAVQKGWWAGPGIVIGDEELGCLLGQEYEFSEELVQSVTPPTTLSLSNSRGDVTLTGGAGDEIRVVVRKKVCAATEAEAERLAQGFEPVLEKAGTGYEFRWKTSAGASKVVRAEVDMQVPQAVNLELALSRGNAQVNDVQGDVQLALSRGDARLARIQGGVQLSTSRGDVQLGDIQGDVSVTMSRGSAHLTSVRGEARVAGRGEEASFRDIQGATTLEGEFHTVHLAGIAGPTRFESRHTHFEVPRIEGEVTFDYGDLSLRGIPGDVSLITEKKDIEMEDVTGRLRIENRHGPVVIRFRTPPTRDIEVENRSADIELYLPQNSGFEIDARARDGEIESDFPGLTPKGEDRKDQTLSGTYGARRASIRLSTTYGTIHLRRTLAAPAAPTPPSPPSSF